MKIDMHCHYLPRDCFNMTDSRGRVYGHTLHQESSGSDLVKVGGRGAGDPILEELCDPVKRIRDMDNTNLDMQLISPSPPNINYELDAGLGLAHARKYNDGIAEVVRAYPDRFMGMATLPMQDIIGSIWEMERTVRELKFKGVEIHSNINGKNLDDVDLLPFYKKAQDLGVLIYIHPANMNLGGRLDKYGLNGLIGLPSDTAIAIASLIFGGIMEKFPKLKFLFSHAGGSAPYILGRWEHGYKVWPETRSVPKLPSEYFKLLYFDTVAHFDPALAYLVSTVGPAKVVLGSDYPYVLGDMDPVATVRNAGGISMADKHIILETSARDLLGI